MMVSLFGLGLGITMTLWGTLLGGFGQAVGLDAVSQYLFLVGSAFAFVFGLWMVKVVNIPIPESGLPAFVQKGGSMGTPFLMGLLLGNWGVGCPDPVFWVLVTYILGSGDFAQGALLTGVYSVGRSLPIIGLGIVAILGVNLVPALIKRRTKVDRFFGLALIAIAGFLVSNVIAGDWFEQSWTHIAWNWTLHAVNSNIGELRGVFHSHPTSSFTEYGFILWMGVIALGVAIAYSKGRVWGK